jgi:serine/threonine protein phosphatase PrpC
VGALITEQGQRLTVFNIGDSEAVLSRGGKVLELTSKHSPNRDDERLRVLAAQGWITEEKYSSANLLPSSL